MSEEDRYSSLHKKIQAEKKELKKGPIKAYELAGKVASNLKLLKSLIQSEKVKLGLFEEKNPLTKPSEGSTVENLQNMIVAELSDYDEIELAKFSIPKKYFDECYELLVSAWRRKVNKNYSQTLTFIQVHFSKESFRAFVIALSLNVTLKALRLEDCGLEEYEMKLLAVLIKIHPSLTFLHLDKNPIKDEGLTSLLAALKHNEHLIHLSLIETSLSDKGALKIVDALPSRPLKSLHLEKNRFEEGSVKALIKAANGLDCNLTYDEAYN